MTLCALRWFAGSISTFPVQDPSVSQPIPGKPEAEEPWTGYCFYKDMLPKLELATCRLKQNHKEKNIYDIAFI